MMEDKKIEQFKELVRRVRLSEKEAADLRYSILEFAKSKPIRERTEELRGHIDERSWLNRLFAVQPMPIALAIILFVTAGGGVSLAAENALPGDALYSIKVNVNEEVRARLAVSSEARTDWEIQRLERRLTEAAEVESRGEVEEEVRSKIEEVFARQARNVEARIADLEARGNAVAAAQLSSNSEAILNVHERILAKLSGEDNLAMKRAVGSESSTSLMFSAPAKDSEKRSDEADEKPKGNMKELLAKVRETRDVTYSLRAKAEDKVNLESAAEGRLKAAEHKLGEVKKYLEGKALGEEERLDVEASLAAAAQLIIDGKEKLSAKEYKEAFSLFLMAHRRAQEAKLMIESGQHLRTSASINVSLEGDMIDGTIEIESDGKSKVHSVTDEIIVNPDGSTSSIKVNSNIKVKVGL